MEQKQTTLNNYSLEREKGSFLKAAFVFLDGISFDREDRPGRPFHDFRDVLKILLIMSYNGMSYRRTISDAKVLYEAGTLSFIPPRSTLNDYMNDLSTLETLEKLIPLSAMFFRDTEDTLVIDSSWFALKMYAGGHRFKEDLLGRVISFEKCRKLHIGCLLNSRVIAYAKSTHGTHSDMTMLKPVVGSVIENGFEIKRVLADAGYNSKEHYAFCQDLGLKNIFIDFKKRSSLRRAKSALWKSQLFMFKNNPEEWHANYRFRVVVEGIFSSIKRKHNNYLRARKNLAQDCELLLKCLVHNLCIIGSLNRSSYQYD